MGAKTAGFMISAIACGLGAWCFLKVVEVARPDLLIVACMHYVLLFVGAIVSKTGGND